jgi:hypothetical protein
MGHKDGLQYIPQVKDDPEIPPESNTSKDPYLAAYIATGITITVILITLLYFFIKRCRSSRVSVHEPSRKPLLDNSTE